MEFRTCPGQPPVRITLDDAAALDTALGDRFDRGAGFALATLNLDHLVKLRSDAAFATAYARQDFVTADGNPVVWVARLGGQRVTLLPGADLILPIAQLAAARGLAVALIGTTQDSLARAGAELQARVPGLVIAARIAPPMGFDPDSDAAADLLREVAASGAALAFLALGAPKQERLAARGRDLAPGVGFVSIGAGLDFLSGQQRRAPDWVRAIAMEWLWRMLSDPRRLAKRYLLSALILPGHAWRALLRR